MRGEKESYQGELFERAALAVDVGRYLEDISVIYEGDDSTWESQFSAIFTHNAELQDKCGAERT